MEAGRSRADKVALSRAYYRLLDLDINIGATCNCVGPNALCKTAFAFDDQ
jgi:hypothetical protein